ncbi:MAG: Alpha-L-fucosidase [Candidatus Aminicenantes bacterium]|nr:Alpha-L-fucosidase [Candidatus Aminicenantes bacterium]
MRLGKSGKSILRTAAFAFMLISIGIAVGQAGPPKVQAGGEAVLSDRSDFKLWYKHPAAKWTDALPVGNGRLGAMVFGKTDEERIQLNEETRWSGGPYSQTVKGGHEALPEIQKLIFQGEYIKAHRLFGRRLMGYPVEQQKYQSLGDLIIKFTPQGDVQEYRHELDLDTAIVTTSYAQGGVRFVREVFSSPVDQVIVVHLTADRPGSIGFTAELRGWRNDAHSNYGTDYFQMDGFGADGLVVRGRSADYLGIEGSLRYEARLLAVSPGGRIIVDGPYLRLSGADAVTLYIAAATNFTNFKDVSADPKVRVNAALAGAAKRSYEEIKADHIREHRRLFRRAAVRLPAGPASGLPTDERLAAFDGANDPALASLIFQFGRYLLISSSRPGTQPANLQGIWNESMNPSWDSKYTTNINTEMNYWHAEVGNLAECAEPLFRMIRELTEQGREVAREHYGAGGWVFHQNTDLWRVAAPMDGPDWGTFTAGGAWLCTHLWEHYLFSGDLVFLREAYPLMKGAVEFFLDFLVEHPQYGWLVTNPSTSPENFPARPGNDPFYDEVCAWMTPGTTICAGSTIDMQILSDLFVYVAEAAKILEVDEEFQKALLEKRGLLAPMRIGKAGDLQEWLEDWGQKEKSHRHISHLYGLFPGNQISLSRTPELARGCRIVLEQRGLEGNGWSSAWKAACWARLAEPGKALENFIYAVHNYTLPSLFSICSKAMQVDGSFGFAAAIAEMLLQSHEGKLNFLPALPKSWPEGSVEGLRARGGFEVSFRWREGRLDRATVLSVNRNTCRIKTAGRLFVATEGGKPKALRPIKGVIEFDTHPGKTYVLTVGK